MHQHHSAHLHANSTPSNGTSGITLPIVTNSSADVMRYGTRPNVANPAHPMPSNLAAMAAAAVAVAAATNPSNPSTPSSTIAQSSSLYPPASDIGAQIIPPHVSSNNSITVTQAPDSSIPSWSQDSNAYLNPTTSGHSTSGDSNSVHSNLVSILCFISKIKHK